MSERVFLDQSYDGTAEYLHFDDQGELVARQFVTDVESVLDDNKRAQCQGNGGYGATREMRHIASIPPSMLLKWANERGVTLSFLESREGFREIVLKMIRDPDYRWLRRDL